MVKVNVLTGVIEVMVKEYGDAFIKELDGTKDMNEFIEHLESMEELWKKMQTLDGTQWQEKMDKLPDGDSSLISKDDVWIVTRNEKNQATEIVSPDKCPHYTFGGGCKRDGNMTECTGMSALISKEKKI